MGWLEKRAAWQTVNSLRNPWLRSVRLESLCDTQGLAQDLLTSLSYYYSIFLGHREVKSLAQGHMALNAKAGLAVWLSDAQGRTSSAQAQPQCPDLRTGLDAWTATSWESGPTWVHYPAPPANLRAGRGCRPSMPWAGPRSHPPSGQVRLKLRMRGLQPLQSRVPASCWGWEESCDLLSSHVTAESLLAAWPLRQEPGRWGDRCRTERGEAGGQGMATGSRMKGLRMRAGGEGGGGRWERDPRVGNGVDQGQAKATECSCLRKPADLGPPRARGLLEYPGSRVRASSTVSGLHLPPFCLYVASPPHPAFTPHSLLLVSRPLDSAAFF